MVPATVLEDLCGCFLREPDTTAKSTVIFGRQMDTYVLRGHRPPVIFCAVKKARQRAMYSGFKRAVYHRSSFHAH